MVLAGGGGREGSQLGRLWNGALRKVSTQEHRGSKIWQNGYTNRRRNLYTCALLLKKPVAASLIFFLPKKNFARPDVKVGLRKSMQTHSHCMVEKSAKESIHALLHTQSHQMSNFM